MKVSIITVCRNSEKTIRSTLESVFGQRRVLQIDGSKFEVEYIVIDGASTDGTVREIGEFAGQAKAKGEGEGGDKGFSFRWVSEPDRGMYDALNKGLKMASGDIVGILNGDDVFAANDVLARVVQKFRNPEIDGIWGDIRFVGDIHGRTRRYCTGRWFRPWMFRFAVQPAHPSTFFRRECFAKFGGYSLDYGMYADFEFLLRFIWKNGVRMSYLPVCTTVMRLGGASTRGLKATLVINRMDLKAIRAHGYRSSLPLIYLKYLFKIWGFVLSRVMEARRLPRRQLMVVERFWPEDFLSNDFAKACLERGLKLDVLCQVPSYPFDRIYEGWANRASDEEWCGIRIHRVSTVLGYNSSVRRKVWNYVHFAFATFWWALRHGRRYDRVFVYHTAALTMATSVFALRGVWRLPVTIWTQDLWPDAVYAYGFPEVWWRRILLNAFVRAVYGCCGRICVSCPSYVRRIKALTGRDAEFIPQWEPDSSIRKADGRKPGPLVFMFAGNLGVPQNLENDIEGFVRAAIPGAELWLVGGGVRLEGLQAKFGARPNVKFKGRQPRDEMPKWFAQADALVISLTRDYQLTFPGKFQSYIKTGKPLLGFIEGDVKGFISGAIGNYGALGWTAAPDDLDGIAAAYRRAAEEIRAGRSAEYGDRARALSDGLFDREVCVTRLLVG